MSAGRARSESRRPLRADERRRFEADLRRAEAFGVDLTLLDSMLQLTPEQRLIRNDEAIEFFHAARRVVR
jgi:hypothetical protein